jgi:hypothetical protein
MTEDEGVCVISDVDRDVEVFSEALSTRRMPMEQRPGGTRTGGSLIVKTVLARGKA